MMSYFCCYRPQSELIMFVRLQSIISLFLNFLTDDHTALYISAAKKYQKCKMNHWRLKDTILKSLAESASKLHILLFIIPGMKWNLSSTSWILLRRKQCVETVSLPDQWNNEERNNSKHLQIDCDTPDIPQLSFISENYLRQKIKILEKIG